MTVISRVIAVLAAVVVGLAVTGCAGGESQSAEVPATDAAPTGPSVVIRDFEYHPATLEVKVGDVVTVTNEDSQVHTLTAEDKSFDTGPLSQGQSATIKITEPGLHQYFCVPHPYMRGAIQAAA